MDAPASKEEAAAAAPASRPASESSKEKEHTDRPPPTTTTTTVSENLAASLGFGAWPHSDEALVQALRTKAEQERTQQEYYRSESTKRVLQILDAAARLQIPGASLPLLFTGNDELAQQVITQATSRNAQAPAQSLQQSQQQQQQSQHQQMHQQLSPLPAHILSHKSPRTPVRTSALTSPVDLGSPAPFLPGGPVSQYTTPQQGTALQQAQQSQSLPSHFQPPPQQQAQQQRPRHQSHLSFDSTQDSIGDRSAKKHRHAVSALPPTTAHGPLSPPAYPGTQDRPVVSGFYPPQLIPPRLPHLQSLTSPLPQPSHPQFQQSQPQQQPQQQQQQPQQQQPQQPPQPQQHQQQPGHVPHGFTPVPVAPMPAPLNTSNPSIMPHQIPGGLANAMSGPLPLQMVQQQPVSPSHALAGTPSRHAPSISIDSSFSSEPRAGSKRGLAADTSTSRHAASSWNKGHRQSLSTGSDLQIHQWKPKQLLRDNRWKISNPFSRTKGSKSNTDSKDSSHPSASQRSPATEQVSGTTNVSSSTAPTPQPVHPDIQSPSHGTASKRPSPEHSTADHSAVKVEESSARQGMHSRSPSRGSEHSTAAVVAAHNNKRRSMTHARRRSAASYPVESSSLDDANRRDEGVAVLASLASEQWRRDRENPPTSDVASGASTRSPSRTANDETPANASTPMQRPS